MRSLALAHLLHVPLSFFSVFYFSFSSLLVPCQDFTPSPFLSYHLLSLFTVSPSFFPSLVVFALSFFSSFPFVLSNLFHSLSTFCLLPSPFFLFSALPFPPSSPLFFRALHASCSFSVISWLLFCCFFFIHIHSPVVFTSCLLSFPFLASFHSSSYLPSSFSSFLCLVVLSFSPSLL